MTQDELLKSTVDLDDMLTLQEDMNKAQEDTTPFATVTDNTVKVVGDANKTEQKSRDYSVRFRFPKSMADNIQEKDIIKTVGDYVVVRVEFNDVHITPRRDYEVVDAILQILPFFKKIDDKGTKIEDLKGTEMLAFLREANDEVGGAMYEVAAAILNVDKSIKDYMILTDVFSLIHRFIDDFPEVFNEADVFFG